MIQEKPKTETKPKPKKTSFNGYFQKKPNNSKRYSFIS